MNINTLANLYTQNFLNQTSDLETLKAKNEDLYLVYLLSFFSYHAQNQGFAALVLTLKAEYLEDLELSLKMIGADQATLTWSEVIEYCLENHIQYHQYLESNGADSDFKTALSEFDTMLTMADFDQEIDQKMLKMLCNDALISI